LLELIDGSVELCRVSVDVDCCCCCCCDDENQDLMFNRFEMLFKLKTLWLPVFPFVVLLLLLLNEMFEMGADGDEVIEGGLVKGC